jgi:transposase
LSNALSVEEQLAELTKKVEALVTLNEKLVAERDEFRKLYQSALELCRKLELGILGQKRERLSGQEAQLSLSMLNMMLGEGAVPSAATPPPSVEQVRAHERIKPTGRKPLPENLPRIDVEVLPPEVQQQGLEAFERIGEEVTETVERRPASLVVVRTHKPKFVPKDRDRLGETEVFQAAPPELPIERGLAGPGLLADTIVRRWETSAVEATSGWSPCPSGTCSSATRPSTTRRPSTRCSPTTRAIWSPTRTRSSTTSTARAT